jgi:hypothetical protein
VEYAYRQSLPGLRAEFSIEPIRRTTVVKIEDDEIADVLAYRCRQGHLFLVRPARENTTDPNITKK